jgi:hypothetical protein
MAIVPKKNGEMIGFYATRQAAWATSATLIGITSGQATTLDQKISAANDAKAAFEAAQIAAKDSTITYHAAADELRRYGAELIAAIKAKALSVGGTSVYTLASIPPPATPSPVGNPGTPYQLKVELKPNGSLFLKWLCDNPVGASGTIYQVGRKNVGDAQFTYIGGAGVREFTDNTLVAGSSGVVYRIQAVRSTAVGDEAEFIVNFGIAPSGAMTIQSVDPITPTRKAA